MPGRFRRGSDGIFAFRDGTFEGGETNAGMISAGRTGLNVGQEATFGGKISNSGQISAGLEGIFFSRIGAFANSTAGGIVNGGTITAGQTGINVFAASTFQGGIDNGGTIKAPNGIRVDSVTVFGTASASAGGGITNSGVISGGGTGIQLFLISTFFGRGQEQRDNLSGGEWHSPQQLRGFWQYQCGQRDCQQRQDSDAG